MVLAYYVIICFISLICCSAYYFIKRKYFSTRYAMIFLLAFLSQFCYVLLALSQNVREALIIYKFLYIGGCYLPLAGLFLIFSICKIEPPKWVRFIMIAFTTCIYMLVLSAGYSPLFYKNVDIEFENGVTVLVKEYGPLHILFYLEIGIFLIITLVVLMYGWIKKPDVSKKNLAIAAFMQVFSIFAFFVGRLITKDIEWMALADLVDEIGFLIIMNSIGLYRVDNMVSSSIFAEGEFGYISLDFKKRYLSATDVAKRFFPEIAKNQADHVIEDDRMRQLFDQWIEDYKRKKVSGSHVYRRGEFIYLIRVSDLYDGRKKRGFLLEISDDTAHQQHLEGIERYNKNLNEELKAKTKLIRELKGSKK